MKDKIGLKLDRYVCSIPIAYSGAISKRHTAHNFQIRTCRHFRIGSRAQWIARQRVHSIQPTIEMEHWTRLDAFRAVVLSVEALPKHICTL